MSSMVTRAPLVEVLPRPDSDGRTLNTYTRLELRRCGTAVERALDRGRPEDWYTAAFSCEHGCSILYRDFEGHAPAMACHLVLRALTEASWEASKGSVRAVETAARWRETLRRELRAWEETTGEEFGAVIAAG